MPYRESMHGGSTLHPGSDSVLPITLANSTVKEVRYYSQLAEMAQHGRRRSALEEDKEKWANELEAATAKSLNSRGYRALRAKMSVAMLSFETLHGGMITMDRLETERQSIWDYLTMLVKEPSEHGVSTFFDDRLRDVSVRSVYDKNSDRFTFEPTMRVNDLGAFNTAALVCVFSKFPISALRKCANKPCGGFFVPSLVGRKRTKGVIYCSALCMRTSSNARRYA